jgi:autotransporter adhesin
MFSAYRRPSHLLRRELLATTALTVGLGVACATGAQAQSYAAGTNATASGTNATAIGPNATGGGAESFAGGYNATAPGGGAVAIGSGAGAQSATTPQGIINYRNGLGIADPASGTDPSNIRGGMNGNSTPVNESSNPANASPNDGAAPSGTAVGKASTVGGAGGVAIGYRNTAGTGTYNSTAIGSNNAAGGSYSIAIGYSNLADGRSSVSMGTNNWASGDIATAIGRQSYAMGAYSFAQGFVASAYGTDGIAIGRLSVAGEAGSGGTGAGSSVSNVAIGDTSAASGGAALALGSKAKATSASAVAIGSGASAANARSVAIGAGASALRGAISGSEVFSGVALGASNAEFSVGATGAERQVTNVAGATRATDAVNLRQLRMVGDSLAGSLGGGFDPATGAYSAPSFGYGGTSYAKATDAIQAIDTFALRYDRGGGGTPLPSIDLTRGGTVGSAVSITGLAPATVDSGAVALSQMPLRYSTTASPTVANPAVPSNDVTLVGAAGGRPVGLHNVAPGDISSATSTDAVNGGQLYATNQQVAGNTAGLSSLNTGLANGTIGLVQQDATSRTLTVGKTTDGTLVDLAGTQGTRRVTGLASGILDNDAVAFRQLRATGTALGGAASYDPVTGAFTAPSYSVGGRSYSDVGSALGASNSLAVQYVPDAAGSPTGTVDLAKGGSSPVALRGVGAGRLTAGSTDAVNGGQLYATNQQVSANATGIATNASGLSSLNTGLANGTVGLVQQDPASRTLTVGKTTDGTLVDLAGTQGTRRLAGLSAGLIDSDAATLGQLRLSGNALSTGFGGGAAYDPVTGAFTAPSYSVGGRSYSNVGGALAATNNLSVQYVADAAGNPTGTVDLAKGGASPVGLRGVAAGRLSAGSTDAVNGDQLFTTNQQVASLSGGIAAGTIGLLRQDQATGALSIAATTGGTSLSLVNASGKARTVTGVAAGSLAAGSTDALNGAQLYATNQQVSANATGIATNASGLSSLNTGLANGTVGLVQQDATSRTLTVGKTTDGTLVDLTGTQGARRVTGLASGILDNDAVAFRQLRATGTALGGGASYDPVTGAFTAPSYSVGGRSYSDVGSALGASNSLAVQYVPDAAGNPTGTVDLAKGGSSPVALRGVGAGRLTAGSTDAVNGGQLYATNQQVSANATGIAANASGLSSLNTGLANGTIGLVQQDPASRTLTVGKTTDGTLVDLTGTQGTRRLAGLSAGLIDSDAATLGQLRLSGNALSTGLGGGAAYDPVTGAFTAPSYSVGGRSYSNVASALAATNNLSVQYLVDAAGNPTGTVDLAKGGASPVVVRGVAAGRLSAGSTDAVNGDQLYATNQQVAGNATGLAANAGGLADLRQNIVTGTIGLVRQDPASRALTVGAGTDGPLVDFANGAGTARTLTGVAASRIASGSLDAVNGTQLYDLSQRVDGNGAAGSAFQTAVAAGTVGLVRQDPASGDITVGAATPGTRISLRNGAGDVRLLTGLGAGTLAATSTDAVTGAQLYDTNQRVAGNSAAISTTDAGLSSLNTGLANGTIGLVQQDPASRTLTVGKTTDGTLVDLAGTQGTRRLAGLSAGLLDSDAATLGQLRLSGNALSTGLGGGAAYDPVTGAFTAPSYSVGGRSYSNVGGALAATNNLAVQYVADAAGNPTGAVDLAKGGASPVALRGVAAGRLSAGSTDAVNGDQLFTTNQQVASLSGGIAAGTIGLLRQDQATGALSIAAATGGTSLSLVNASGKARTVTGVAAGSIAAGSTEAVNGGQLYATNQQVARNATDIAANAGGLASLSTGLAAGAVGLVQQDATSRTLTVGKTTDGTLVDLTGTQGARRLAGLSAGILDSDAATLGQLRLSGNALSTGLGGGAAYDPVTGAFTAPSYSVGGRSYSDVGSALAASNNLAVQYVADAAGNPTGAVDLAKGGTSPVGLRGVAAGRLSAGSTDAVNGDQLSTTNRQVASLSGGIAAGTIGLLRQDQATGALSIAATTGGTSLSLVNVAGDARTVTGVAAGSVAAGSTEAVNGGQLYATNQQVATLNTAIQQGAVGLVQQDPASRGLTVGAGTDGTTVAFADRTGAARTLTGIGAGRIAAGSQEGVNGGQIYGVTASLAAALGGGTGVAADGTLTLPRFTVQGGSYDSVGGALGSLDAAVTSLNTSGSRYVAVNSTGPAAQAKGADTVAIGPGAVTVAGRGVALGAGAVASRAGLNGAAEAFSGVAVASNQGAVSVGDAGAERQITNVAGATQDTDAVNLRQLRAVGHGLAGALGGGAGFSADGTFTAPSYAIGGQQYASVGAALGAVDAFGARYDVDPATGGRGQSLTLAGGDPNQPVLIRNVAGGILPTDAANVGQVTQAAAQARADANAYTDRSVAASYSASTAYTDAAVAPLQRQMTTFGSQLADLNRQVGEVRGEARRSAAIGLAAAALRFDDRPGKLSVAAGGGVWRGESAASFGLGYTLPDGWARVNATGVAAGRDFGVGAGASFTLN